jgi:hypothetical protein
MRSIAALCLCWMLVGCAGPGVDQFVQERDGLAPLRVPVAQDQSSVVSETKFRAAPASVHFELLPMDPLPEAPLVPLPIGCGVLTNEGLPKVTASLGSVMRSASLVESAFDAGTRVFTFHLHEPTAVWWEVER